MYLLHCEQQKILFLSFLLPSTHLFTLAMHPAFAACITSDLYAVQTDLDSQISECLKSKMVAEFLSLIGVKSVQIKMKARTLKMLIYVGANAVCSICFDSDVVFRDLT